MKTINITIENHNDIYNKFNDEFLNDELDNFLLDSSKSIRPKEKIAINIKGKFTKEEEDKIKKVINNHYNHKYGHLKQIDKYDDIYRLILLIIGILLIIISENLISFISELFLIAGWVVIWEMVYDIIFNQLKRTKNKNHYQKLAQAQINFETKR